jgi:hypothetical protein
MTQVDRILQRWGRTEEVQLNLGSQEQTAEELADVIRMLAGR